MTEGSTGKPVENMFCRIAGDCSRTVELCQKIYNNNNKNLKKNCNFLKCRLKNHNQQRYKTLQRATPWGERDRASNGRRRTFISSIWLMPIFNLAKVKPI